MPIQLTVNGTPQSVTAAETTPLLDVLRNQLDLKGARYGCGLEQCGSCMVLVDGEPVYACSREVGTVAGRQVTTIEGLGTRRHTRTRCSRPSWTSRPASAATACPASSCPPRRCWTATRRPPAPRSSKRWTSIFAAAAPIRASCARWNRPPPPCAREPPDERHAAPVHPQQPAPRQVAALPARRHACRLAVGKVELGQGNVTALAQIAAEELDIDLARIAVLSGDTEDAPDEGQTTSSQSIEVVRPLGPPGHRRDAGPHHRPPGAAAELQPGRDRGAGRRVPARRQRHRLRLLELRRPRRTSPPTSPAARRRSRPRPIAWSASRCGGATCRRRSPAPPIVHDMVRPDMLHARVLRQPNRGARLALAGRGAASAARPAARSASCAPATSSPSSARTRPWCSAPPPRPRRMRSGRTCSN